MSADLQEPLVPAEVDLRDYRWMPFYGDAALSSDTWILACPEARCAAMTLWWQAWHQVPAGSLPSNARLLASLAGYGIAVSAFEAIQEQAIRGWVLCSDGRLYHPFLAKLATEAWEEKREFERRRADDRARKREKQDGTSAGKRKNSAGKSENSAGKDDGSAGIPAENALTGQDRTGQENTNSLSDPVGVNAAGAANNTDDLISAFDAALVGVWGEGARRSGQHSTDADTAKQWAESGITATLAGRVLRERFERMRSRGAKPPFSMSAFGDEIRRTAAAQPAEPAAERSEDDERSRWRLRLTGHRRGMPWSSSWGDPPGEPGCQAPRDLIAEILPHLVPSADVIPLKRAAQ